MTVKKKYMMCLTSDEESSPSLAPGLLMQLTNLERCSKCFVISVARIMSMMEWRRARKSSLHKERSITFKGEVQ